MKFILTLFGILILIEVSGKQPSKIFTIKYGESISIACDPAEAPVVQTALRLFCNDYQAVFSATPTLSTAAEESGIIAGTMGVNTFIDDLGRQDKIDLKVLQDKKEAFLLKVVPIAGRPRLIVAGSDKRGTAYGILEISRLMGVSPWIWWADVRPDRPARFELDGSTQLVQYPSVEFRGIFLNDEDWGLTPWSWQTYEPSPRKGQIGPKTHERIFELLLRLRANTFWPAMHECSIPFYFTPGNKEIADQYGIYIGTSHCEPMLRNTNGEWKTAGLGDYDYVNNPEEVRKFWEQRVKETAGYDNIYTLGMRGVHDGKMQGAKTLPEQKETLGRILKDQRQMLANWVNPEMEKIPQVFIPYKEVLDIYHAGLQVPEDVTLMWCDDNYGYIRHFPDSTEQTRKGGNGIYYHISYWGRPHDYLWLSSTHPALIHQQMSEAYQRGIRKIWILNVGDIKPAEYQIEFFLDMAWNMEDLRPGRPHRHLSLWTKQIFGRELASQITTILEKYYRLAYIRKPEFMGNTRVEEKDPRYKIISDLPWSEQEIRNRLKDYAVLADEVVRLSRHIPRPKQDCWFQLVQYPVLAANEMNKKMLYAQLARHNKATWQQSRMAYDSIVSLTQQYNQCNHGKWNRIMDFQPRQLPVFQPVTPGPSAGPLLSPPTPRVLYNASEYTGYTGNPTIIQGLGYEGKAVELPAGSSITFSFSHNDTDTVRIVTTFVPTHPVNGKTLRCEIRTDNETPIIIDYHTKGRSEEWKLNVLRNQALRRTKHRIKKKSTHTLTLKALDEGIIVDQIRIY